MIMPGCTFCDNDLWSNAAHRQCIDEMARRKSLSLCWICGERPRAYPDISCERCHDEMPWSGFSGSGKLKHK